MYNRESSISDIMPDMGIYKITNTVNGKIYIGQSTRLSARLNDHVKMLRNNNHQNQHLQNSYNKYGDVFEITIIKYCDDEEELDNAEKYYIAYYDATNPQKGYNKQDGGKLNSRPSAETRKKMSEARKGQSPWNKGGHHSDKTKKKISEAKKGQIPWMKGKHHSDETKKKISEANKGQIPWMKGKHHSDETKKKISEARKGQIPWNKNKKFSQQSKEKMSKAHNSTGFYRIRQIQCQTCQQGFTWIYVYYEDKKYKSITNINLLKLKEKVEAQGLPWEIIDEEKAKQSLELNNKYHKGEKND